MDFNNNGRIDMEDILLTEMILDDEKHGSNNGNHNKKPSGGGCLTSFLFIISVPVIAFLIFAYVIAA